MFHDIDVLFQFQPNGDLLIELDDLGTPGLDVSSLVAAAVVVAGNTNTGFFNSVCSIVSTNTWDVDFVKTGALPFSSAVFEDDFDDDILDASLWVSMGTVTESGTILAADPGGSIQSNDSILFNPLRFTLRNVYDSRGGPALDFSRHTLGYSGFISGSEYMLIRNDNQPGNVLALEVFKNGVSTTMGTFFIGDQQPHDIEVTMRWSPSEIRVWMDDLATVQLDKEIVITDPNFMIQSPNTFIHLSSPVSHMDYTWDLDIVTTGPVCGDSGLFLNGDLNMDCVVDSNDVVLFANSSNWLNCNILDDPGCPTFIPPNDSPLGRTRYTAVPGTATVDGDLSDWNTNAPWTPMEQLIAGVFPPGVTNAMFACRYDAASDIIYGAVKITDPNQIFNSTYLGFDQQDHLQLYVQGDPLGQSGDPTGVWGFAQEYFIGFDGTSTTWSLWPDLEPIFSTDPGLTAAAAVNGNEITYEFSVKVYDVYGGKNIAEPNSVVTDLVAGKEIGFDLILAAMTPDPNGNVESFGQIAPDSKGNKTTNTTS